jgi:hypothetical protein
MAVAAVAAVLFLSGLKAHVHRTQQTQSEKARRAAFKKRYIGGDAGGCAVALLVADETGQPNQPLGQALAAQLTSAGLKTTASLFASEFVSDGLLTSAMAGTKENLLALELTNQVRVVLLGRQSVAYSTNGSLSDLITATLTTEMCAFSSRALRLLYADKFSVAGAGLTQSEARAAAEERGLRDLTSNRLQSIEKCLSGEVNSE